MTDKIIEVEGVKLAIDTRTAKTIEAFRIGDNVKVLTKSYSDSYTSHPGVIVGFDNFRARPTIIVAYLSGYYDSEVKFVYLNQDSKDVEICHIDNNMAAINKVDCIKHMDNEIRKKELEVQDLKIKKEFFTHTYESYFVDLAAKDEEEAKPNDH